jgi:hypothetical protein
MKRKTFITLGILMNLLELTVPLLFNSWGILIAYFVSAVYVLAVMVLYFTNDMSPLTFWFVKYKEIYHSGYGTLYTEITPIRPNGKFVEDRRKNLYIFEQRWLSLKLLTKVEYHDDINRLINSTKYELDKLYKESGADSKFEQWDGYLDTESKRDDKLNKLGVK